MTRTQDEAGDFAEDAIDRRTALNAAVALITADDDVNPREAHHLIPWADDLYYWLRQRVTLRAVSLTLTPGTPIPEGTTPMATTFTLPDNDEVTFTLGGLDAKGAATSAPADTWNYSLSDPDSSGAVLTVADDTLSATVAAGTPTANLALSVSGMNTGLSASCAITVEAGAAVSVDLVPGTPADEPAPAPPAEPPADVPPAV